MLSAPKATDNTIAPAWQSLLDLVCLIAAFPLAIWLRDLARIGEALPAGFRISAIVALAAAGVWIAFGLLAGLYREPTPRLQMRSLVAVAAGAILTTGAAFVATQLSVGLAPRSLFLVYGVLLLGALLSVRFATVWLLSRPGYPKLASSAEQTWQRLSQFGERMYQWRLDLWLALALGIALAAIFLLTGMNYSPDSLNYVKAAGQLRFDGLFTVLPDWPPLFPILAALANLLTPDPARAAEWIVALSLVVTLAAFALILRQFSKNAWLNLLFIGLFFSAGAFFEIGQTVWSEMPFLALVLLSLFFSGEDNEWSVYLAYTFAGLAALTRYAGIMLPAALTLALLLNKQTSKQAAKWLALGALSLAPLGFYLLRNLVAFGTLTGSRVASDTSLFGNLSQAWATFTDDFFPVMMLATVLAILVTIALGWKHLSRLAKRLMLVLVLFSLLYLGFLLYTASTYNIDDLDTRLLFPLEMLFILVAFISTRASLMAASQTPNGFLRLWVPLLLLGGLLAGLGMQIGALAERLDDIATEQNRTFLHDNDRLRFYTTASDMSQAFVEAHSMGFEKFPVQPIDHLQAGHAAGPIETDPYVLQLLTPN